MKTVYLVRHGETDANVERYIQGPDQPLNPTGFLQADRIAERMSKLSFDRLFCSTMRRAVQTAKVVAKRTGHKIESFDEFCEVRTASSLIGPVTDDDMARRVSEFSRKWSPEHLDIETRYEDEETTQELLDRVDAALELLKNTPDERIAVVSHSTFLRTLLFRVITGGTVSAQEAVMWGPTVLLTNAGLSVLRLKDGQWKLLTWNDHAHFADD